MANFPTSPTNGQTYTAVNGTQYTFNSALGVWNKVAGSSSGVTFTTSATAPASPHNGDEWYSTTNDVLYLRVTDGGGTSNWVDVSSAGTSGTTLPANASGALINNGSGTLSWAPSSWTTAGRPASPFTGQSGFNTTLGFEEVWNGTSWEAVASEGGMTGYGFFSGG